jgi:hypothetical protein
MKFDAPHTAIMSVDTENKKQVIHTFVNVSGRKPLRVVLGTSFDGSITGDLFRDILIKVTCPKNTNDKK